MEQTLTVAVGANLVGASLPDGSPAYAVAIDNPSGNWLNIYPGGGTCPPYVQGFVAEFPGGAAAVDVRVLAVGPAGQVSTSAGDRPTITLYDEDSAPPASTGAPFTTGFGAILTAQDVETWPLINNIPVTIIPGVAGKRIRVRTIDIALEVGQGNVDPSAVSPVTIVVSASASIFLASIYLVLGQWAPTHDLVFPQGFDLPVGSSLQWNGICQWQTEVCSAFVSYELI